MTRTKLDTPAFADQSVDSRNIADGTVQAQDVTPGSVSADKLASTLDLSSKTVTLANSSVTNAKLANSSFTINGSSVALGASTSIIPFLDWQAVVVADGSTTLSAVAGRGYFLDTNTGVIEVFLPSSPSRGDTIGLVDYSGTFATNQIIINTGAQLIDSTTGPEFKVTTNNSIVELVYVDANKGWQVILNQAAGTTPDSILTAFGYDQANELISATGGTVSTTGDFKVHQFTGDGDFIVSAGGGPLGKVDYLVVGGGGGGGKRGGGGGAGGHRTSFPSPGCNAGTIPLTPGTYPITVGAGGPGCNNQPVIAKGSSSVFSTITSAGGGGGLSGATADCGPSPNAKGGSGGGGGAPTGSTDANPGGSGNTPPVSPPQGNDGGAGRQRSGGGGGGSATAGTSGNNNGNAGVGGSGTTNAITGSSVKRAGGGGGAVAPNGPSGNAGSGDVCAGAGDGVKATGNCSGFNGNAATANTGSGGGAASAGPNGVSGTGGAGGKGIVIIRYKYQ